ncbi:MAG: hypothetical protein ACD_3C00001G0011 [uncultured bacterium (gcode 4)]|uniref:Uncharacterized protein n=1 Tax=uncultured bacterium (gcode 4) TaxID=1234023 RepID=K2GZD3_9BACT|nr:MAG: hypothetical protein ACD_3C00001G0011 [uncultured bacterium (gcode 4)]
MKCFCDENIKFIDFGFYANTNKKILPNRQFPLYIS